jgi:hypothetical protein
MSAAIEARRRSAEEFHQCDKLRDVRDELARMRALALLIDLRAGGQPSWDAEREIEGTPEDPLDDSKDRPAARRRGGRPLSKGHAEGVGEVAHHLARRHSPPTREALGSQGLDPVENLDPIALAAESVHWREHIAILALRWRVNVRLTDRGSAASCRAQTVKPRVTDDGTKSAATA